MVAEGTDPGGAAAAPGAVGRRRFLAMAAMAAGPLLLPGGALARAGRPGANDRLVLGHIGIGAQGLALLRRSPHAIGAVCDVDPARMRAGAALAAPGVRLHDDFRALLEQGDLDGVVIATPDHWHVAQAVLAAEAGKAVYLAAPAMHRIGEAPVLLAALARCPVTLRVGHPALGSLPPLDPSTLADVVAAGPPTPLGGDPAAVGSPPPGVDWADWLGPHPRRAYHPDLAEGGWRWHMDLGGGNLVGGGTHAFAALLAALPEGADFDFRVTAQGVVPLEGLRDCPAEMQADFELLPGGPAFHWEQREGVDGVDLRMTTGDAELALHDCAEAPRLEGAPDDATPDAFAAWATALRAGDHGPAQARAACRAATLAHAANLAFQLGRPLRWRESAGQFDDPAANRFLQNPGWTAWLAPR